MPLHPFLHWSKMVVWYCIPMTILPLLSVWRDLIWDFWDGKEVADMQPRLSPQAFCVSLAGREAAGKESFWKSSQYEPEKSYVIISMLFYKVLAWVPVATNSLLSLWPQVRAVTALCTKSYIIHTLCMVFFLNPTLKYGIRNEARDAPCSEKKEILLE